MRLLGRRYSHARRGSAGKKENIGWPMLRSAALWITQLRARSRDHEICRFGRLRMPSMDASPTRVMKTRAERHVVPGRQYSRENRTKGSVLIPFFAGV